MLKKLKEGFEIRSIGYYFTAVITVLSLILAIVYISSFSRTSYFSWISWFALVILFAGNCGLLLIGKNAWSPLVSVILSVVAICFYILGIYHYVSIVLVGIDVQTFSQSFIFNTILYVLLLILSSVNIFLKQSK